MTEASRSLVMAIGDSGIAEPTDPQDVVMVPVLPTGPRNLVTPASIRFLFWRRDGNEARPIRIRSILKPNTRRNQSEFPKVLFVSTPFTRYTLESGPVMGDEMRVMLTCAADAVDPFWETLSAKDRMRLLEASRRLA